MVVSPCPMVITDFIEDASAASDMIDGRGVAARDDLDS